MEIKIIVILGFTLLLLFLIPDISEKFGEIPRQIIRFFDNSSNLKTKKKENFQKDTIHDQSYSKFHSDENVKLIVENSTKYYLELKNRYDNNFKSESQILLAVGVMDASYYFFNENSLNIEELFEIVNKIDFEQGNFESLKVFMTEFVALLLSVDYPQTFTEIKSELTRDESTIADPLQNTLDNYISDSYLSIVVDNFMNLDQHALKREIIGLNPKLSGEQSNSIIDTPFQEEIINIEEKEAKINSETGKQHIRPENIHPSFIETSPENFTQTENNSGPENIHIPASWSGPEITLNTNGIIWIKGLCIPIDSYEFFDFIINWIQELLKNPPESIELNIQISYHNDTASKYLLQILYILNKEYGKIKVKWYYEEWDDEIIFLGEALSESTGIDFDNIIIV